MENVRTMQILIVEDNPDWLRALEEMYNAVFQIIPIKIDVSSNKEEALCKLAIRNWDIVSLDINLHGDKKPIADKSALHANLVGQDVLHMIAEDKLSRFVVVITSIASDEEILGLQFDGDGLLEEELMSLQDELERLFPRRSKYFWKNHKRDINKNIANIKKRIMMEENMDLILEACGIVNKFERVSKDVWRIVFNGKTLEVKNQKVLYALAKLLDKSGCSLSLRELSPNESFSKKRSQDKPSKVDSDDIDNIAYSQNNDGDAYEDYGGSGMMFSQLSKDERDSLQGVIKGYTDLAERISSTFLEEKRTELKEKIRKTECILQNMYHFTDANIDQLRKKLRISKWLAGKLSSQNIDINKNPRDAIGKAIERFRETLPKAFEEFSLHIARTNQGGSLAYSKGFYKYIPYPPVTWQVTMYCD